MAVMRTLTCLSVLATVSMAARLKGFVVPDLLMDIYKTDMVSRCKLQNVSSILPSTVHFGDDHDLRLSYNLTASDPLVAAHLVFDVEPTSINAVSFKRLKVSLNGVPTTLNTRLVKNSLVAKLDHGNLRGMVEVVVNPAQLTARGVKAEETFILGNVEDSCRVWQHMMKRGTNFERSASFESVEEAARRRTRRSAESTEVPDLVKLIAELPNSRSNRAISVCKVYPYRVDFRLLNFIHSDFIIYPDYFNMGTCKGGCSLPTCKKSNVIIRRLLNDMPERDLKGIELPPAPTCLPTRFSPLQVLLSKADSNVVELRVLKDIVVEECGCL